ncbi:MAG: hypothetical protein ACO1QS_20440 [Verrucomicrobiota bacterium]
MKSAEQNEVSPYASALARVRTLRSEPHAVPEKPSDFAQRLKQRILQARIRLHLPVRSPVFHSHAKAPDAPSRWGFLLWCVLPFLLLAFFIFLLLNPATSPPASFPIEAVAGVQTFTYPVPPTQKTLSEGNARAITAQTLARSGYDLREWEGAEYDSIKGVNTIAKDRFNRVDDRSGYYIFEQWLETELPKNNQPVTEKFRRLTVTLRQEGDTLTVILSDSVRSRHRVR